LFFQPHANCQSSNMYLSKLFHVASLTATVAAHLVVPNDDQDMSGVVVNGISYSTRVKYMRLVLFPILVAFSTVSDCIRPTKLSSNKADPVRLQLTAPSS
jgi:hypothetical protein